MAKRVAVLTDATAAGSFFPLWHGYYGGQFGTENLFVVTYRGMQAQFAPFALGAVWDMGTLYSDQERAATLSRIVALLLDKYDLVVRCDIDEFLVAHPLRHASLAAYVQGLTLPYVTARGFDVFEETGAAPLRLDGVPLLAQRRFCVGTMSLNKTAVVAMPVNWSWGFHFADVRPCLDDLFLLHMKFADVARRIVWFDHMRASVAPGSFEDVTYSDGAAKLQASHRVMVGLPRRQGWAAFDDPAFARRYLERVEGPQANGLYTHPFDLDTMARAMPEEVRAIL